MAIRALYYLFIPRVAMIGTRVKGVRQACDGDECCHLLDSLLFQTDVSRRTPATSTRIPTDNVDIVFLVPVG